VLRDVEGCCGDVARKPRQFANLLVGWLAGWLGGVCGTCRDNCCHWPKTCDLRLMWEGRSWRTARNNIYGRAHLIGGWRTRLAGSVWRANWTKQYVLVV